MTRYVAFLSYSHRNKAETEWLHRALERYSIPKKLVGRETARGKVPARLIPIFRDRDELAVSSNLGGELKAALENSAHLIVIASPASARSTYVQEEIRTFKAMHGEERVFALIVDGEPYASQMPGREEEECFPPALRFQVGPDGAISDTPAEPIAADIRPGKDGRRLALRKLVAGLTGLRLDDLVQREAQRRARRLTWIASGASLGMLLTTGLAVYANQQRLVAVEQRKIAERETAAARAATDYLIGTFELSDPATENPRTVSLVTILSRGAERARTELRNQPEIEARLVTAVGRAYTNLGLLEESETALARAMPAIKRAGPDGAPALIALATNYLRKGRPERALTTLANADRMLGGDPADHLSLRAQLSAARGNIAYINGTADEALKQFDQAVLYLARERDVDPKLRADILEGRGRILIDLGRFDEAEAALQAANRLYATYRGEQHINTGYNFYYLALAAYSAGNNQLAEERIGRALAIVSRVLDKTNPIRADVLSLQGSIYQARGKLDLADRALAESIDAYRAVYKGRHYNIGIAEFYRAQVAEQRGQLQSAIDHLDEAQRNYEASYGKQHANIGEVLVTRAALLAKLGRLSTARSECAAGIGMLNATIGPDSSFTQGLRKTCDSLGQKDS
jgi:tetratricopeptide (TPR) repeat protein